MAAKTKGAVLKWLAALVDALADERPPNQTRILATATALLIHANPDGTRCRPGMRRIANETGQHLGRVSEAMDWLIEGEWITFVRRVAHGGREFRLTIPQRSADSIANQSVSVPPTESLEGVQRSGQRSGQRSAQGNEPPTSDVRRREEESRRDSAGGVVRLHHLQSIKQWWRRTAADWDDKIGFAEIDWTNSDLLALVEMIPHRWDLHHRLSCTIRKPRSEINSPTGWLISRLRSARDEIAGDHSLPPPKAPAKLGDWCEQCQTEGGDRLVLGEVVHDDCASSYYYRQRLAVHQWIKGEAEKYLDENDLSQVVRHRLTEAVNSGDINQLSEALEWFDHLDEINPEALRLVEAF